MVVTKRWHGALTMDFTDGIQKFHTAPTPRVGGIPIVLGLALAWVQTPDEVQDLLTPILLAGMPAFLFGVAEDITKRVGVMQRLLATMASGLLAWWLTTTAANAHDITQAHALLHGEEEMVFADSGYRGVEKREEIQEQHPDVDWQIAMTPGKRKALNKNKPGHALRDKLEKLKASIRAKVEHLFRVIKCQFGHSKARYRGLAKNTNQLLVMFALSNLWMVRKRILQGAQA